MLGRGHTWHAPRLAASGLHDLTLICPVCPLTYVLVYIERCPDTAAPCDGSACQHEGFVNIVLHALCCSVAARPRPPQPGQRAERERRTARCAGHAGLISARDGRARVRRQVGVGVRPAPVRRHGAGLLVQRKQPGHRRHGAPRPRARLTAVLGELARAHTVCMCLYCKHPRRAPHALLLA
jgi:nitrite reductase/ring-hydroxylating ferredoxin subunit